MSSTLWACDSRSTAVISLAVDRQLVVLGRVEVVELVDPVQHVRDQLLQEQPGGDADLAAELAGDGAGQSVDVFVGGKSPDPVRAKCNPPANRSRTLMPTSTRRSWSNGDKPKLHGTGIVEAGVGLEIHMQPLGQRLQPLHTLRPIEEGRRPGDQQVEIREPPAVDVVDQLPQGIQPLLPHVASDSLQRFDLVEDEHQPRVARILQDQQQPTQESSGRRSGPRRP